MKAAVLEVIGIRRDQGVPFLCPRAGAVAVSIGSLFEKHDLSNIQAGL